MAQPRSKTTAILRLLGQAGGTVLNASIGSCSCGAKSSDILHHQETCRYRQLREADGLLDQMAILMIERLQGMEIMLESLGPDNAAAVAALGPVAEGVETAPRTAVEGGDELAQAKAHAVGLRFVETVEVPPTLDAVSLKFAADLVEDNVQLPSEVDLNEFVIGEDWSKTELLQAARLATKIEILGLLRALQQRAVEITPGEVVH